MNQASVKTQQANDHQCYVLVTASTKSRTYYTQPLPPDTNQTNENRGVSCLLTPPPASHCSAWMLTARAVQGISRMKFPSQRSASVVLLPRAHREHES